MSTEDTENTERRWIKGRFSLNRYSICLPSVATLSFSSLCPLCPLCSLCFLDHDRRTSLIRQFQRSRLARPLRKVKLMSQTSTTPELGQPQPETHKPAELLPADVHRVKTIMVNCYLVGMPGTTRWVLIDAGLPKHASKIIAAA